MEQSTLIIHWVFSWLALLIMGFRLAWRKIAKQNFTIGDYLTIAAMVCVLTRVGVIHVVIVWGTNNISEALRKTHVFTDQEIYQREVGSKLTIANRFVYNSYLWIQKLVLLDVYRRIMADLRWEKITLRCFLAVFAVTYIVVQASNVFECKPFHLYWQVVPDPGQCAKAQVQLLVLGILNIVTDVMLLVLPIPVMISWNTPWSRKIKLYVLFALGIFIILITVIRLPINSLNKSSQVNRTTWASTELLVAAIVVNAPTLYGLWNITQRPRTTPNYNTKSGSGVDGSRFGSRTDRSQGDRDFWHPDAHGLSSVAVTRADSSEEYAMGRGSDSFVPGIMRTEEVTVSSTPKPGPSGDDVERGSVHSSQKGILRD